MKCQKDTSHVCAYKYPTLHECVDCLIQYDKAHIAEISLINETLEGKDIQISSLKKNIKFLQELSSNEINKTHKAKS